MDKKENPKSTSRRKFIDKSLTAGAAVITAVAAAKLSSDDSEEKVVRMIAADGNLYEVNTQNVMRMCNGKISNAQLREWLDTEQKKT